MRLADDGTLRLSPTDLANHLACAHLTQLELAVQRGELERPHVVDPYGQIILRKGNEHEAAYLARLEADGLRVARMLTYDDEGFDADEARRGDRGGHPQRRSGRHLPGLPHGRHLARVRRLPRAAARRHVRARRHEARALGEAAPRHPALLLRRAARADPGAAARARPRRARLRRAGDAADGGLHRVLPPEQGAAPGRDRGRARRTRPGRGPSTTARSATSATSAATSGSRRTTRSSSRDSDGCTPSGSAPRESRR